LLLAGDRRKTVGGGIREFVEEKGPAVGRRTTQTAGRPTSGDVNKCVVLLSLKRPRHAPRGGSGVSYSNHEAAGLTAASGSA
jgi:hypothetical protein